MAQEGGHPSYEQLLQLLQNQAQQIAQLQEVQNRHEIHARDVENARREADIRQQEDKRQQGSHASNRLAGLKLDGVSLPRFYGKPKESVDEFFFSARMFFECKGVDMETADAITQRQMVSVLATCFRDGAASWFHMNHQDLVDISSLYKAMTTEFVPRDIAHRAREELSSLRQTGSLDSYIAQFRGVMAKIQDMHEMDKVHHFTNGLREQTRKEVRYRRCSTLSEAISFAQAYDRAYCSSSNRRYDMPPPRRQSYRDGPTPMDISNVQKYGREECLQKRLCFYCKKPGHMFRDCRSRKSEVRERPRVGNARVNFVNKTRKVESADPEYREQEYETYDYPEREIDVSTLHEEEVMEINAVVSERPNRSLICKQGKAVGRNVTIMIDSGADHNLIKKSILPKNYCGEPTITSAKRFDGTIVRTATWECTENVYMGDLRFEQVRFTAWEMKQPYDIILGQPWLQRFNPSIDWRTQRIRFTEPPLTYYNEVKPETFKKRLKGQLYQEVYCVKVTRDQSVTTNGQIKELLEEFKDIFPEELPKALPPKRRVEHLIELKEGAKPKRGQPFRLSRVELDALDKYVEELLQKKWIEESDSEWLCNMFAVPKKDPKTGKFPSRIDWLKTGDPQIALRWVNDYRYLNNLTNVPKIPLPIIDELFERMEGCKVFSTIDLASGYHQMRMDSSSKKYTAFRTRNNIYHWNVAPMGLAGMPGTWTRFMTSVLPEKEFPFVVVYLDDICIFSKALDSHVKHLRAVFNRLRAEKLFAKPSKCEFAKPELGFLGHIVSAKGLHVDPRKVTAIRSWPTPRNRKDIQRFLGLAGYYRKFINKYADMLLPLSELMKSKETWKWSTAQETAFQAIKDAMSSAPILQLPNFKRPFRVTTDSSDYCIGAVLSQHSEDGDDLPIAYYSKKLGPAECNWPAHEKELYAIKAALGKWRPYLYGVKFDIFTDNAACRWFLHHEKLSPKMARWLDFFGTFQFTLHHRPGKDNVVADALSRPPKEALVMGESKQVLQKIPENKIEVQNVVVSIQTMDEKWISDLKHAYRTDKLLKATYYRLLKEKQIPEDKQFIVKEDELLYKANEPSRLIIPWTNCKQNHRVMLQILEQYHDSPIAAHAGISKTYMSMRQHFYWLKMFEDVSLYVQSCEQCKRGKSSTAKTAGKMISLPIPTYCWQAFTWDLIIFLPLSNGYDAILVVVDRLSKRPRYIKTHSNVTSEGIAQLLFDEIIKIHGIPERIISDRDTKFTSKFTQALAKIMGIRQSFTTAHRAQADGQTERQNRTLEDALRCTIAEDPVDWDKKLSTIEYAHCTAIQASTKFSPFEIDTGRKPRAMFTARPNSQGDVTRVQKVQDLYSTRCKLLEIVMRNLKEAQERQAKYYNKKHADTPVFNKDDFVFLKTEGLPIAHLRQNELDTEKQSKRKLMPKWIGPFRVLKRMGPTANTYKLKLPTHMKRMHPVFNVDRLKKDIESPRKFIGRPISKNLPIILEENDNNPSYVVQELLAKRRTGKKTQYLVSWAGLPDSENSWENEEQINHVVHWLNLLERLKSRQT